MANWSQLTSNSEAARRAGGRRQYNFHRHLLAGHRQRIVLDKLSREEDIFKRGLRSRIAKELGVSRSTISRDIRHLISIPGMTLAYRPSKTLDAKWIRTLEPLGERLAAQECDCGESEEPRHRLGHVLKFVATTLEQVEEGRITMEDDDRAVFTRARDVLGRILVPA